MTENEYRVETAVKTASRRGRRDDANRAGVYSGNAWKYKNKQIFLYLNVIPVQSAPVFLCCFAGKLPKKTKTSFEVFY